MTIEEVIGGNFKSMHHKAIVNLRHTSNFVGNQYNRQLAKYGLSLPQFNVLRILRGAKQAINVKVVKDRMLEKSPNTTRLFDKLVEKQFITRHRCKEDRRVVFLEISEAGLAVLAKLDLDFEEENYEQKITEEEAILLSSLLDKLRM